MGGACIHIKAFGSTHSCLGGACIHIKAFGSTHYPFQSIISTAEFRVKVSGSLVKTLPLCGTELLQTSGVHMYIEYLIDV